MRRRWLTLVELWDDSQRWSPGHWGCGLGLHWPIRWDESCYPRTEVSPPEPGWCCQRCGYVREPYRSWWWEVKRLIYLVTHGEWAHR